MSQDCIALLQRRLYSCLNYESYVFTSDSMLYIFGQMADWRHVTCVDRDSSTIPSPGLYGVCLMVCYELRQRLTIAAYSAVPHVLNPVKHNFRSGPIPSRLCAIINILGGRCSISSSDTCNQITLEFQSAAWGDALLHGAPLLLLAKALLPPGL